MNINIQKRAHELGWVVASQISKIVKISFIVGSKTAFFSLSNCIIPVVGLFSNSLNLGILFLMRIFLSAITSGISLTFLSFYHIPQFFGALYFSTGSKLLKILVPSACILLFITNPVGSNAMVYSLHWLIPIAITLIPHNSIFLHAIGSTFTTHAVGSIIWLYTKQIDAATWKALCSVVWAERLLLAIVMVAVYYGYRYATSLVNNFVKSVYRINLAKKNI